jgi:hypothetical protein
VRAVIVSLPERLMNEVAGARSAIVDSYFRLWARATRLSNDAEPDHVTPASGRTGQSYVGEERETKD